LTSPEYLQAAAIGTSKAKSGTSPSIDEPLGITVSQIKEDANTHHASPGLVLHFTNKRSRQLGQLASCHIGQDGVRMTGANGTHPDPLNSKKSFVTNGMMDHKQRAILLVGCLIPSPQSMDPQKNLGFSTGSVDFGIEKANRRDQAPAPKCTDQ